MFARSNILVTQQRQPTILHFPVNRYWLTWHNSTLHNLLRIYSLTSVAFSINFLNKKNLHSGKSNTFGWKKTVLWTMFLLKTAHVHHVPVPIAKQFSCVYIVFPRPSLLSSGFLFSLESLKCHGLRWGFLSSMIFPSFPVWDISTVSVPHGG